MKPFRILALLVLLSASSCTFNKLFYQADKLPQPPVHFQLRNRAQNDTVYVSIADNKYQPVFTNSKQQPYDLGYSLESVLFTSSDGNRLNGWFLTPVKARPNGITLLFLHGNGGNLFSQFAGAVPFVKRGFKVFIVDYSGYGYSEGRSTRRNFLSDGNSALSYLLARPDVKGDKVVIYGQSLGGHLSATVAAQNEAKIDGLVMEGAPSSHKDIAAYMSRPFGFMARLLVKEGYSAKRSIAHYHKPLLLIHSTEDKTVPFFLSRKIYERANEPKMFYEIKHPHINGPEYYADSISKKIVVMLKQ